MNPVLDVLRGSGQPLPAPLKDDMEARFGADLSGVRLHTDSAARASATEVSARAYTSGSHVVIGDGGADKHTLAHELTHVIQQRTGPVAGTDHGGGLRLSDPSDPFERAAESTAVQVMSGSARALRPHHPRRRTRSRAFRRVPERWCTPPGLSGARSAPLPFAGRSRLSRGHSCNNP